MLLTIMHARAQTMGGLGRGEGWKEETLADRITRSGISACDSHMRVPFVENSWMGEAVRMEIAPLLLGDIDAIMQIQGAHDVSVLAEEGEKALARARDKGSRSDWARV